MIRGRRVLTACRTRWRLEGPRCEGNLGPEPSATIVGGQAADLDHHDGINGSSNTTFGVLLLKTSDTSGDRGVFLGLSFALAASQHFIDRRPRKGDRLRYGESVHLGISAAATK